MDIQHVDPARLFGVGLYTASEASRLTGIPTARIRRWLRGYRHAGGASLPLWAPGIPQLGSGLEVTFLDLIEARFVHAFVKQGVSLKHIRAALQRAREIAGSDYPFSTQKFRTDGRRIFAEVQEVTGDKAVIDLVRNQFAFKSVIEPSFKGLEFEASQVVRWRPWPERKAIVLDPSRSFGAPIIDSDGVPTGALARAFAVRKSFKSVAHDYLVPEQSVRDAVAFEERLAA